jgi:hypothetical protein
VTRSHALALVAALALAGCGYHTGSLVPQRYRTIAVPVFGNATRRHDVEWELTRQVVEEIQSRTPLVVVSPGDSPDLVMKGVLAEADEDVLSHRDDQRIRESVYFLTADVEVTDGRSGKPVMARRRVTERESFVPVEGENVRTARETAGRALAERIVRQLEEAW